MAVRLPFMADTLYSGRTFRTFNVIDEGNREVLGIEVAHSESARDPSDGAVDRDVWQAKRSASGQWQRAHGDRLHRVVRAGDVELRFIQPGKPNQNGFIERFNKSYRNEVFDAYVFESIDQVRIITERLASQYYEERPHDSLGRVPPLTFMPRRATAGKSTFELYL